MIKKYVTYTSSLSLTVMEDLKEYATRNNQKKNKIIEEAIIIFLNEKRKKEYVDSFKKMKNDPEREFLAEAGLGDFLKMIEDYEKS